MQSLCIKFTEYIVIQWNVFRTKQNRDNRPGVSKFLLAELKEFSKYHQCNFSMNMMKKKKILRNLERDIFHQKYLNNPEGQEVILSTDNRHHSIREGQEQRSLSRKNHRVSYEIQNVIIYSFVVWLQLLLLHIIEERIVQHSI